MRQFILCASFITLSAVPALAGDRGAVDQQPMPRAAVIVDEEAGIVRFIIDGKETMRLDATGLHIREALSTGSSWTSYGRIGCDSHIGGRADEE